MQNGLMNSRLNSSDALRKRNVLIGAILGGVIILGTTIGITYRSLDNAYVRSVAQFTPPFGIAGTDPYSLRHETRRLAYEQFQIARLQSTIPDAYNVYSSLYPKRFLLALADLEESRLALIEQPTTRNARAYLSHLTRAKTFGEYDARKFESALGHYANNGREWKFYGFSGKMTSETIMQAARSISTRMKETDVHISKIIDCTLHAQCPTPVPPLLTKESSPPYTPLTEEGMENKDFFMSFLRGYPTMDYALSESACTKANPSPTHILARYGTDDRLRMQFLDSLYFFPQTPDNPVVRALNTATTTYIIVRPFMFYICPAIQQDIGMVVAMEHASKLFPDSIPRESDGTLYDSSVRTAVQNLWDSSAPHQDPALSEIILMLHERSARLDQLVAIINRVHATRALHVDSPIPLNSTASNMFLTHSAFTSLFLAHNPDAGTTESVISFVDPKVHARFLGGHKSFQELRDTMSRAKVWMDTENLRIFDSEGFE